MEERDVIVEDQDGNAMATFSLIAVLIVVGLIALFVWQPWNTTLQTGTATTTISQPGAGAGATSDKSSQLPSGKSR